MKDIENKFGKTVIQDKMFTAGGAEKFLKLVLKGNNIDITVDVRRYGNCISYVMEI